MAVARELEHGTPLELMRAHVDALFTHDAAGRMLRVNEPHGALAPRVFLGRTVEGSVLRFRADVDAELVAALERASRVESADDSERFEAILSRRAPVQRTESGPAYRFPSELPPASNVMQITSDSTHLLQPHLAEWVVGIDELQPALVRVVDDAAVAICASVRLTSMAYEAGVETAEPFRSRGHAMHVVSAWASAVRARDRMPLYSTSWSNERSRALARKLGLIQFGSDLHIT